MTKLTEHTVLARTRAQDLKSVRKLNAWGSELTDVSIVKYLPNVEVLSLSVNGISSLQDFAHCRNLQELYLRKNNIADLSEIKHLQDLSRLRNLWLADNPCAEAENYRLTVIQALPQLQKLDNITICPEEFESAKTDINLLDAISVSKQCFTSKVSEVTHTTEIVSHQENSFTSESHSTCAYECTGVSKTSTPQPSPMESFPPTEIAEVNAFKSSLEELVFTSQDKESEQNVDILSHSNTHSDDQNSSSGKQLSNAPEHKGFEPELPLDRHQDLVMNDRYSPGCTITPHAPGLHRRSERPSALRMLPKGGKNRNANILSAVLCLIKELDWPSLEVVDTAVHCLMEEMEAEQNSNSQGSGY